MIRPSHVDSASSAATPLLPGWYIVKVPSSKSRHLIEITCTDERVLGMFHGHGIHSDSALLDALSPSEWSECLWTGHFKSKTLAAAWLATHRADSQR